MVKKSRTGLLVGAALLVGVAAGALGMMSLRGGDGPYAGSPGTRSMGAGSASTAFVAAVAGNCEMSPVLPKGGEGDGREMLQARPGAASAGEVGSLILAGKEAAAAGRQRDAEVDFLNACRNAAALRDGDPVPLADAMYQLGRHYANVGALGTAGQGKDKELFERAERLYSASLEGFRARYGEDHEKTRFAREGLITVQQATGGKAPAAIAKAPPAPAAPAPAEKPTPEAAPATAPVAAAPAAPTASAAPAEKPPVAAAPAASPAPQERQAVVPAPAQAPEAAAQTAREERRATAPARRPRVQQASPAGEDEATPRESAPALAETRRTAPRVQEPVPPRERAPDVAEQRPAAASTPRAERRPEPETSVAAPEEPRPRPQARRAPPREFALPDEVLDVPPPRPSRSAPAYAEEALPPSPPPDYSSSGAGPLPDAEGSPSSP